jgi:AraC-like DNA-binding protein
VAGGRVSVRSGDLILTPPGIWHRYAPNGDTGWTEYWLMINGEEIHRLVREGFVSANCAVLEIDDKAFLEDEYKSLMDRVERKPQALRQIATAALQVLATSLDLGAPKSSTWKPISLPCATDDTLVARACQYIWNHHEPSINVTDVVKQLRVARRTLERRFRDTLGISIFDEIMKCRIERAKQMLSDTTLALREVATLSGFSRTCRMSTEFQKYEGLSPSAYRDRRHERKS